MKCKLGLCRIFLDPKINNGLYGYFGSLGLLFYILLVFRLYRLYFAKHDVIGILLT